MPKKGVLSHEIIIEGAKLFKDDLIKDYGCGKRVAYPSDIVWNKLSKYFDFKISSAALHVFIKSNRGGVLNILGLFDHENIKDNLNDVSQFEMNCSSSDYSSNEDNNENLPTKKLIMTLSPEEWQTIKPVNVAYKRQATVRTYVALPKGEWSHIIAEHFWEHTHLQCCLTFRRAKVYPTGQAYVIIVGRCKICYSNFKGVIHNEPHPNSRVMIDCSYVGNFYDSHDSNDKYQKRRMTVASRKKMMNCIINQGKSSEFCREEEALRLMKKGDSEPSVIPTGNALRVAKSKEIKLRQRHSDSVTAMLIMKLEDTYKDAIHDIGLDPFFIHFYTPELINLYRAYSQNTDYPSLIIDATGTVVKKFSKLALVKTQTLYLYEAVVYDNVRNHTFTACSMISEKHDNIAIYSWLSRWLKNGVVPPKETCSDMSLALLSALVRSFTQYSSVNDYIHVCSLIVLENISRNSFWLPKCFIRIDVAHFVKNVTKWSSFKTVSKRVKEVYLRAICVIIKSQSITEIRSLILSIFVVASNESVGCNINSGFDTACVSHKKKLLEAVSSGFISLEHEYNEILSASERIEDPIETTQHNGGIPSRLEETTNLFSSWADTIYSESCEFIEEGNDLNPLYLPSIIPLLKNEIKMLPLWSGVMVPIFGYGAETKSSAAVESMFHKIKNVVFNDIELPTNLETFIERRIASLKGSALLKNNNTTIEHQKKSDKCIPEVPKCALCSSGIFPKVDGIHKCAECGEPVHALDGCSYYRNSDENIRVCNNCFFTSNINDKFNTPQSLTNISNTNNADNDNEQSIISKQYENNLFSRNLSTQDESSQDFINIPTDSSFRVDSVDQPMIIEQPIDDNTFTDNLTSQDENFRDLIFTPINGSVTSESANQLIVIEHLGKDRKFNDENAAIEKWNRNTKRKLKSYLTPNTHLKHLNLSLKTKNISLPILKNGSRVDDLKALNLKGHGRIILTNTCAFDTAVFLFMTAMCDSNTYFTEIERPSNNNFIQLIKKIISNGISLNTYRERAKIIMDTQDPTQTPLKYNQILLKCETTFSNLLKCVLPELPTISDKITCTECDEKSIQYSHISFMYDNNFDKLDKCIYERLKPVTNICHSYNEKIKCKGMKTITPSLSNKHIFIEVLKHCEGSNAQDSVKIKLNDIPPIIKISDGFYELRGVCSFTGGNVSDVGHYKAYCKRENNNWELYDDLAIKSTPIKNNTYIQCEYIFYTV